MKFKKSCLIILFGGAILLNGCGSSNENKEIKNLCYDGEYISWSSVEGASGYVINIDSGRDIKVNQSSKTIKYKYDSSGKDFNFYVEALIGEQGNSDNPSFTIDFENIGDITNFHVEDGMLTWDYVDNAEGYDIFLNGELINEIVTSNSYELEPGDFNAKVRSYKKDLEMENNNNKYYSLWTSNISGKMLEPVENLSFDSDQFTWSPVSDSSSYTIRIGDKEYETYTANYVSGVLIDDLSVQVKANGDLSKKIYSSKWSYPKEYKYIPAINTLRVENGALVWDRPENAVKYKIKVNGIVQKELVAVERYDTIQPGVSTTIQVLPVSDSEMFYSSWSNPMTINILRSPSITFENNVIKWNAVSGAEGYSVNIIKDGKEENYSLGSETLTFDYDFDLIGKYSVAVKATVLSSGNGIYESKYSNVLNFTHLATPSEPTIINQPLEENQLMISTVNVANASKYYLYSNNVMIKESTTPVFNIDVRTIDDSSDEVSIKLGIRAVGSINDNDIYLDSQIRWFNIVKLAAPKNLQINGNQLSWSSVTNAEKYIVTIDGKRTEVTSNYYTLTDISAGNHDIYVQAEGNGENVITSSHSNVLSVKKLAKPVISTTKSGDKFYISWQAIDGATSYNVVLGNQNDSASSNSFIISDKLNYFVAGQGTQVSVYAKGNGTTIIDSDPSNTQTILRYDAPTNLSLTSDNLVWNAPSVNGVIANDFSLIIDENEPINLTGTTYSLSNFASGTHKVKIKANGKIENLTIDSDYSNEFTFTKLESITNINKISNKITWDTVQGARSYEIKFSQDSTPKIVYTNEIEVEYSKSGTYAVSIVAKGDNISLCDSDKIIFDQNVKAISTPVKEVNFSFTQNGNEIKIKVNENVNATGYALYVGGALVETNGTGDFIYIMTPDSLSYSFQVAYIGQSFGEDGIYYINSNKSSEIIVNYAL